jgi:hypothetical protein
MMSIHVHQLFASTAGPGEILIAVTAAMLLRDDVFQVEGRMGISDFR